MYAVHYFSVCCTQRQLNKTFYKKWPFNIFLLGDFCLYCKHSYICVDREAISVYILPMSIK